MEDNIHPHPLTIDLVSQEILRHVSPSMKDLLLFRQVCRFWGELATPIISSRRLELPVITFKEEGNAKMEVKKIDGGHPFLRKIRAIKLSLEKIVEDCFSMASKTERLENKIKKHLNSGCISCKADLSLLPKYIDYLESDFQPKITFPVFHFNTTSLGHPIVQEFFQAFGHTVKKLYLNQLDEEEYSLRRCPKQGKMSPSAFRKLLLTCTELEELVFGCVDPQDVNVGFLLPDDKFATKIKSLAWVQFKGHKSQQRFINDLLKVCPSLERFLTVDDSDGSFVVALKDFEYLSSLKELTLHIGCLPIFQILLGDYNLGEPKQLRLKRLKFYQILVNSHPEQFQRFLDTLKSSLETLIVTKWQVGANSAEIPELILIPFPDVMEKLEVLKIGDVITHPISPRLLLQPRDFQRQFPALRTLILGGEARCYDLDVLFAPARWEPQFVLQGLELPSGIGHEVLARVGRLFPNVKELKLKDVTEETLRVLWTQWHRMESLFLDLEEANMETSLTGLSSYQVLIKSLPQINIPTGNPSITNFQDLKELWILKENKIVLDLELPGEFLSDLSIHYSLSKLPKLEFLCVHEHKFTEEGIRHLCHARGLKWKKDSTQWQKNLEREYKPRPNCNEDFANYKMTWGNR